MSPASRERIMQAACQEFAAQGYAGARIEAIAKSAGVNKAMLFYYFSSKHALYRLILQQALSKLFGEISTLVRPELTARSFLESMPRIYIHFFARHPELIKIIAFDLIQNPENITTAIRDIASVSGIHAPKPILWSLMQKWHRNGALSESDPAQVMMNIVSLSVFTFVGLPMIETMSGKKIKLNHAFYEKRIQSVVNVLKKGMLK